MSYRAVNFGKKLALFAEQWQPKVVAEMNDYQFKLVKLQGDFVWHDTKTPTRVANERLRTTSGFDCYLRLSTIAAATSISAMPTTSAGASRSSNNVVPSATAMTGETKA
jgi:hypothetical protein